MEDLEGVLGGDGGRVMEDQDFGIELPVSHGIGRCVDQHHALPDRGPFNLLERERRRLPAADLSGGHPAAVNACKESPSNADTRR